MALSSTEAKFIALTHATKEALWIRHLITENFQPITSPIKINCDNQSVIAITHGNQQHAQTKHFDIRLYFIRDTIKNKSINIQYLPTDQMLADILTKGLSGPKVRTITSILGLY